jgi:hypothetical protein
MVTATDSLGSNDNQAPPCFEKKPPRFEKKEALFFQNEAVFAARAATP